MSLRGLTLAGLLHAAVALALLGLLRTHLPNPPADVPMIMVVTETTPQASAPVAAKAAPASPPLPLPPLSPLPLPVALPPPPLPPPPLPQRFALRPARQAAKTPEQQARLPARDVGEQDVAVSRPALPDADNAAPVYTVFERQLGEQGSVRLRITVLPSGMAGSVTVLKSSGYRVLDVSAKKAVMGWHFQPALRHGTAVASIVPYSIVFVLQ